MPLKLLSHLRPQFAHWEIERVHLLYLWRLCRTIGQLEAMLGYEEVWKAYSSEPSSVLVYNPQLSD